MHINPSKTTNCLCSVGVLIGEICLVLLGVFVELELFLSALDFYPVSFTNLRLRPI